MVVEIFIDVKLFFDNANFNVLNPPVKLFVVFELIFRMKHRFPSLANLTEYCLIVSSDRVRSALHRLPAQ